MEGGEDGIDITEGREDLALSQKVEDRKHLERGAEGIDRGETWLHGTVGYVLKAESTMSGGGSEPARLKGGV